MVFVQYIAYLFVRVIFVFSSLLVVAIDSVGEGLRAPLVHWGLPREYATLVVALVPLLCLGAAWNIFRGIWRMVFSGVTLLAVTRLTFTAISGLLR